MVKAALGMALLVATTTACGGGGSSESTIRTTVPATTSSAVPTTSSTRPSTTMPRSTTSRRTVPPTTAPRATVAPPAPTTSTTARAGRTVALGETFSVVVGEGVTVTGEGLTVAFASVVSDNRCPPGVQCIVAGSATIAVSASKAGMAAASLALGTDGPTSVTYGSYRVELVQLGRGPVPTARLRVSS